MRHNRSPRWTNRLQEDIGGIILAVIGVVIIGWIVFYRRAFTLLDDTSVANPSIDTGTIVVGVTSAEALQQRLDNIEAAKRSIEEEKRKAIEEARRKAEEKRKAIEEAKRKEEEAKQLKQERIAQEKARQEEEKKAAKEKLEKEKAAREKAKNEKAAKEKAEKVRIAKEKAEKEARIKASEEAKRQVQEEAKKKAQLAEKLSNITAPEGLDRGLSSYNAQETNTINAALKSFENQISRRVSAHWRLPPDIPVDGASAQLLIQFDQQGKVLAVKVVQSSGYPLFDKNAVAAVQKASPLPLPDRADIVELLVKEGLLFNFRP